MKVVATSDLHGSLDVEIPECDLLLIAGDVCPVKGDHAWYKQLRWMQATFFPWLTELYDKVGEIVWIGGNHDFICEHPEFHNQLSKGKVPGRYIQDELIEVLDGLTLYGSPWTPNLKQWAFYGDDRKFQLLNAALPKCDILMLHSPPSGILDGGVPEWGSPHIASAIAYNVQPDHVVCGHIHEGYGVQRIGQTTFHNVAHMDQFYSPVNPPQAFTV